MRRTLATTAVLIVALAGTLTACGGSSLSAGDQKLCVAVGALTIHSTSTNWDKTFIGLTAADNADLREVGRDYNATPMHAKSDALPFQARAVKLCAPAAPTAKEN